MEPTTHRVLPLISILGSQERPLCTICQDDENTSDMVFHIGINSRNEPDETIRHCFHKSCLSAWHSISNTSTCPNCIEIVTDLTPTMDKAKKVATCIAYLSAAAAMIVIPPYLFSEATAYILGEGIVSSSILWGGVATNILAPTVLITHYFFSTNN